MTTTTATETERHTLLALALAESATPAQVATVQTRHLMELRQQGLIDMRREATDRGWRVLTEALEWGVHYRAYRDPVQEDWRRLLAYLRTVREVWTWPGQCALARGQEYGHHHLPEYGADSELRNWIESLFRALRGTNDDTVRYQLNFLAHAAPCAEAGEPVSFADESAAIWGYLPVDRQTWWDRANEIATAWGAPLRGPGGLYERYQ